MKKRGIKKRVLAALMTACMVVGGSAGSVVCGCWRRFSTGKFHESE